MGLDGRKVDVGAYEELQQYHNLGWVILPAETGTKHPMLDWKVYQNKKPTEIQFRRWFGSGAANAWLLCGQSGLIVIDCDDQGAEDFWREHLGDAMDQTARVKTRKGHHYYFGVAPDFDATSWSVHTGDMSFDVRGKDTGVIMPPSIHESGFVYEWDRAGPILALPEAGYAAARAEAGTITGTVDQHGNIVRSQLVQLLDRIPAEGGRNVWLTAVAGHIAAGSTRFEDAYRAVMGVINQAMPQPLDYDEWDKTVSSVWKTEQAKKTTSTPEGDVQTPTADNGWLLGGGDRLYTVCIVNEEQTLDTWADFDLKIEGMSEDEQGKVTYYGDITYARGGTRPVEILASTFGRAADLDRYLHGIQAIVHGAPNDLAAKHTPGLRLHQYVLAQRPQSFIRLDALGWDRRVEGFITHEGTIRSSGLDVWPSGFRPDPKLKGWAPFRYGFVPETQAQDVLAEVLTFHDETVTAVFGAWWAACFLKPQIMAQTSLFPFMALEAPSESGKTNGFFAMMMQMNGRVGTQGEYTTAALRDYVSAHRQGIVWIDDPTQVDHVFELLRQTTSEGTRGKKGQDRHAQEVVQLVSPVVLSAEGLGALDHEKALLDRAVRLSVPSPIGRMSVRDPSKAQWDDIITLHTEWGRDLSQLAGTYAQMALQRAGMVDDLRGYRTGAGRHADKIATLRLGARLLAELSGAGWVVDKVDAWCGVQEDTGAENALTREILPAYLVENYGHVPNTPIGRPTVYFTKHGQVAYHEQALAAWWADSRNRTDRQRQLGALSSLAAQRSALGASVRRVRTSIEKHASSNSRSQAYYYVCGAALSTTVLQRAGYSAIAPQQAVQLSSQDLNEE